MLVRICLSVLQMSLIGSGLALVLMVLKPITEKWFGPKWEYYIWLIALLVMVIPIPTLPLPNIFVSQTATVLIQPTVQVNQATQVHTDIIQQLYTASHGLTLRAVLQQIPSTVLQTTAWIWLAVAFVLLLSKLVRYHIFFCITYRYSIPVDLCVIGNSRVQVRKTPLVVSPITIGLCHPVIFLPDTIYSERDLHYILMHELTHYRRHDLFYKWFVMLVCTIHWFNPIAHLVARQVEEACELSCDWDVVQHMHKQEQTQYMNLILDLLPVAKRATGVCTISMASCKKTIKKDLP